MPQDSVYGEYERDLETIFVSIFSLEVQAKNARGSAESPPILWAKPDKISFVYELP